MAAADSARLMIQRFYVDSVISSGSFIEMTASPESQEIAVVTGASTGIGAATARELARRGFHVLAGVRRDRDADAIRAPGIEPLIIDITNPDHIQALATRVHEDPQGRAVRALVNNAGIGVNVPVEAFAIDEWRRLFEVNLFGQVAVTQALLPALIRSKGRVVNISSVGGKVAMATYGPYAGTKFALEAVSDSLRRELAPTRRPGGRGRTGRRTYGDARPGDRDRRRADLDHDTRAERSATARWCTPSTRRPRRPPRRACPPTPRPR